MTKDIISIIGMGYVGLPVAVAFASKYEVVGFDINQNRIDELNHAVDRTLEVAADELKATNILYTTKIEDLKKANFHIVAVPTPLDSAKKPNMSMVHAASKSVGKALKAGDIVVYESTVYPGATEDECVPILENTSGLKNGVDFFVGYSPERINPGDKVHTFTKIKKVVSGQDEKTLKKISKIYASVVEAGVFEAASIKVAEAAKVIENAQRDLNIAFMNELSIIFDKMDIDTLSVLEAAATKWNFLDFKPGLVGGHCVGVDPFYLTHKAEALGYYPEVILAGRRINDWMGKHVVMKMLELTTQLGLSLVGKKVNIIGLTFKENCPDIRNTRVKDIIGKLKELNIDFDLFDPVADPDKVEEDFEVSLKPMAEISPAVATIVAVPHNEVVGNQQALLKAAVQAGGVFLDVKGAFNKEHCKDYVGAYWRL